VRVAAVRESRGAVESRTTGAASIRSRWTKPRRAATSAFWACANGSGRAAVSSALTSTPGLGTAIQIELDVPPVAR
jgi:hypothetical protein